MAMKFDENVLMDTLNDKLVKCFNDADKRWPLH